MLIEVVKLVMRIAFGMAKAYHSYFTKSISLSINIQITIHPLSTDGPIVILVFLGPSVCDYIKVDWTKIPAFITVCSD